MVVGDGGGKGVVSSRSGDKYDLCLVFVCVCLLRLINYAAAAIIYI